MSENSGGSSGSGGSVVAGLALIGGLILLWWFTGWAVIPIGPILRAIF